MATPDMNASEYLQMVLGDVLAKALSEVARERPSDPVQFVAEYLHQVSDATQSARASCARAARFCSNAKYVLE